MLACAFGNVLLYRIGGNHVYGKPVSEQIEGSGSLPPPPPADDFGFGAIGNPIGAPGIPAVGPDVNLGGPINRRGLR